MLVDAVTKKRNIDKNTSRIDVFNPRFKFRALISLNIKYHGSSVKLFTQWSDIKNKVISINDNKISDSTKMKDIPLVRGMIVVCESDENVYVYMPERLVK